MIFGHLGNIQEYHQPGSINMMCRHYHVLALIQGKLYCCTTSSFGVMASNMLGSKTSLVVTLWELGHLPA